MILGGFRLQAIETGSFRLDGGAMFGVVPKVLWQKTNPADDDNRISMHMRVLYGEDGTRRFVIDSGAGAKLDDKMTSNYRIECGPLGGLLSSKGIDPSSVTDVFVTHLHFDHAGGYTYIDGEGRARLTFPNAAHHVQKRQWEAAQDPNEKDRASFFPADFLAMREEGRLDLVEGEATVFDGVRVIPTDGHTPGHQVVLIESSGKTLMYCADLIPLASHVNLPWIMAYDHFPLQTLAEKKKLLARAAAEDWILFFEHDPAIAACRVRVNEKGRYDIFSVVTTEEF